MPEALGQTKAGYAPVSGRALASSYARACDSCVHPDVRRHRPIIAPPLPVKLHVGSSRRPGRAWQAEVVTQRVPFVDGAHKTTFPEFGHHKLDEVVELPREV